MMSFRKKQVITYNLELAVFLKVKNIKDSVKHFYYRSSNLQSLVGTMIKLLMVAILQAIMQTLCLKPTYWSCEQ